MKPWLAICLALVLSGGLAAFSAGADDANSLRVVVIPSRTEVHIHEIFKVALRVENPATFSQTVRVMNCSWLEEWKTSNTNISWQDWDCTKNFPVNVEIPPGGAYTNELDMLIPQPIPVHRLSFRSGLNPQKLSFRMGFTPIDSGKTYWSDAVFIAVTPPSDGVPEVKLKFIKADSEETEGENGFGKNAVDGDPHTFWDTQWQGHSPALPHEIIIKLVPPAVIKGFTYLPRQDASDHGTIKDYEFYVSDNGENFGQPVKQGAFEPGKEAKRETFAPVKCRFIKLRAISEINGLPWTSAAEIGVIQDGENTDLLTNQIHQAASLLAEFEQDKSIDQLESAFRAVERVSPPGFDQTVPPAAARREQAELWLNLLATIDQNIDPSFDDPHNPTNWAAINMAPPGLDGMRYPSGVDPNDIKDPDLRAQYEVALQQNDDKIRRANFQTRLRNIDVLVSLDVGRFFPAYYTSSQEDQSELESLMQQAGLSPARAQKIRALFVSTSHAGDDTDSNLTKQVSNSLIECQKIKPGMTRGDLLKNFTIEGGLFTARHRTFVYRHCPYIKLDVDFTPSDPGQNALEERSADVISQVSKPYLDWSVID